MLSQRASLWRPYLALSPQLERVNLVLDVARDIVAVSAHGEVEGAPEAGLYLK